MRTASVGHRRRISQQSVPSRAAGGVLREIRRTAGRAACAARDGRLTMKVQLEHPADEIKPSTLH